MGPGKVIRRVVLDTNVVISALLGDFLPFSEPIEVPVEVPIEMKAATAALPRLPDPDDRIFLQLAEAGTAEFLVTGDQDLLTFPPPGDYRIISPAEFGAILRG